MNLKQAQEKISEQQAQIEFLGWENKKLQKLQDDFQKELILEVKKINSLGPFKRWFFRGKLLLELIFVIQRAIKNSKV